MSEVTPLHPSDDEEELRAADGRVPGRRGRATRQRLLECTRDMLTTTAYRDVKVIDIAREAGTSPATFYQYFADVEAAILVLAEEMAQQGQHLTEIITGGSWTGPQAFDTSLALVDAFLAFWEDHRPVLRVMDLATDEGDGRFQKIRVRLLNDITNALADVTRASQHGGRAARRSRSDGGGRHARVDARPHRGPPVRLRVLGHPHRQAPRVDGAPGVLGRHRHHPASLMGLTTAADGVAIAYDVTGTGPVLVLVHGITESRQAWDPLIADLAADHTVVAVDVRGHGESGLAADLRQPGDGRRRRRGARQPSGPRDPLVVGHSMGGIVATAFAAAHPCRGVVNVDQSIALGDFQDLVRGRRAHAAGRCVRRGDRRALRQHARRAACRRRSLGIGGLRRPQQEVVLGVWAPLLELSRDELDALVAAMAADVQVPYLALHGIDPGPDYGAWLPA